MFVRDVCLLVLQAMHVCVASLGSRSHVGINVRWCWRGAPLRTRQGKQAEAMPKYTQAIEIFIRVVGKDHPNVAIAKRNLADCSQGVPLAKKLVEITPEHLLIVVPADLQQLVQAATDLHNVAGMLRAQVVSVRLGARAGGPWGWVVGWDRRSAGNEQTSD